MTASVVLPMHVHDHAAPVHCTCFAPFGKGGYGGFALRARQQQEQEQIPLDPPFTKGEKSLHSVVGPFLRANRVSMRVAA